MESKDFCKFQLSFKGQLVENSVDAFDVANTILATAQSLQEMASIKLGEEAGQILKLNISAFREGSLINDFLYWIDKSMQYAPALLPYVKDVASTCNEVLDGYKTYLEIKALLKGTQPTKIVPIDNQKVELHLNVNGDSNQIIIGYPDLRALQSKTLARNTAKTAQILTKEGSLVEEITLSKDKKTLIKLDKDSAQYFNSEEDTQLLPKVTYKGIITKIDSKVRSGYISVGSKRIPFTYPRDLPREKYELLVESLKKRIQVLLIGEVVMNYESEPQNMIIHDVKSELSLFDKK